MKNIYSRRYLEIFIDNEESLIYKDSTTVLDNLLSVIIRVFNELCIYQGMRFFIISGTY